MPEGRIERLVCLGALIALGFLVVLTVPRWQEYSSSQTVGRAAASGAGAASGSAPRVDADETGPPASEEGRAVQQSTATGLRLTATRGDCWLDVREGDERGRVLYAGTLAKGDSVSIDGAVFWVRIGAGQNLSGAFGGRELVDLPDGSATVSIEEGSVSVVELG